MESGKHNTFVFPSVKIDPSAHLRTPKLSVTNELTIPEQTRYLVPIELGRIEKHVRLVPMQTLNSPLILPQVYDQTLEQVLVDLGLDARGVAATRNWQVDGALLRNSLRKLRGICTHPQVLTPLFGLIYFSC